jgi:hypothetical protein
MTSTTIEVIQFLNGNFKKGNKILRKYTVTDKNYKDGDEFIHNGRLHKRSHIGKAIFDHDISSERTTEMVDEFVAGSKLSNKEYYKKYGV